MRNISIAVDGEVHMRASIWAAEREGAPPRSA